MPHPPSEASDAAKARRGPSCPGPCLAASTLLAFLALATSARADVGASGVGDPYFPHAGNGGYDAQHYDLRLRYSGRQLSGTATMTATSTQELTRFNLDLRRLHVSRVTVNGRAARFSHKGQELRISAKIAAGTEFKVAVRYAGVPKALRDQGFSYGFLKTSDGAVVASEPDGASTWFPVNDHPSDKATYTFRIRAPRGTRVVANGILKSKRGTLWTWHEDAPMASYLATIAIGKWRVSKGHSPGGIPTYIAINRAFHGRFSPDTGRIADAWSRQFGPYPFANVGAIVLPPGAGSGALETQSKPVYFGLGQTAVLAHELAHQWFGDSVTPSRWRDIWLNEGFATFAEWLWSERNGGRSVQRQFEERYAMPAISGFWRVKISDPGRSRLFHEAVYVRGGMTLQALRLRLGDETFFTILRTWVAEHRLANATTQDFIALAERLSGRDLKAFFHTWLDTRSKPVR